MDELTACPECGGIDLRRREEVMLRLPLWGGAPGGSLRVWVYCPGCGWIDVEREDEVKPGGSVSARSTLPPRPPVAPDTTARA